MEKVRCGVQVRWTGSSEGRMRRLGLRDQRPYDIPCASHINWAQKEQEYMGGEDDTKIKEEDDGVVALGGGRICIYMDDEDGIG